MQGLLLSQRSSAVPDLQLSLLRCTASQTVKDVGGLSKSTMVVSFLRLPSLLNNKLVAWLSLLFAGGIVIVFDSTSGHGFSYFTKNQDIHLPK